MSVIAHGRAAREPNSVSCWWRQQLEAAGYPTAAAEMLSERADVDLHVAVGLLRAGCPVETALRILL
jgi:hypothetical protein